MTEAPRRGRKPSPEKRAAIIGSALQQFARRGVEASTTRDIAEGAGTTERTLFKHFGSKAALVQAAIEQVTFEFMNSEPFSRVHDGRLFTRDEFRAWHIDFLRERVHAAMHAPDNYRILFSELLRDDDFRRRYGARWMETVYLPMSALLARMQQAGEVGMSQSPAALTSAFFNLNLGYLVTRFALAPEITWESEANIVVIASMFLAIAAA